MKKTSRSICAALALILVVAMSFSLFTVAFAAEDGKVESVITLKIGSPTMAIDGVESAIDPEGTVPIVRNDRTLLPIRAVVEAIGGVVEWDGGKGVTLTRGEDVIELTLDSNIAYLNGEKHTLDVTPVAINNRTMLPIRFIAESFGCTVGWSADDPYTVTITYKQGAAFDLNETVFLTGARITQITISSPTAVDAKSIGKDTFKVTTKNTLSASEVPNGGVSIIDVAVSEDGKTISLSLDTASDNTATLYWDDPNFTNRIIDLHYVVTQEKAIKTADGADYRFAVLTQDDVVSPEVDAFTSGTSSSGLNYRDYQPTEASKDGTHPLVVWLHGGGEGGDNNATTLMANRGALTFATEENQTKMDYPYVLAPQAPDYWLEHFQELHYDCYGKDYSAAIVSLIKEYIAAHSDIDPERVLVVGASMGGYQTWATVAEDPSLFCAMIPLCTAQAIPESMVRAVKDVPSFISHNTNDYVVSVDFDKDAYKLLTELGADTRFVELEKNIIDGETYDEHDGVHLMMTANAIRDADGVYILDWAAAQLKK